MGHDGCLEHDESLRRRTFLARLVATDLTQYDWFWWDEGCTGSVWQPCLRSGEPGCDHGCYQPKVSLDALREGGPAYLGMPPVSDTDALHWADGVVVVTAILVVALSTAVLILACTARACRRLSLVVSVVVPSDLDEGRRSAFLSRKELRGQRVRTLQRAIVLCAGFTLLLPPCAHFRGSQQLVPALRKSARAPALVTERLHEAGGAARQVLDVPLRALDGLSGPLNSTLEAGLRGVPSMQQGLLCAAAALAQPPHRAATEVLDDLQRLGASLARVGASGFGNTTAYGSLQATVDATAVLRTQVLPLWQDLAAADAAISDVVTTNLLGRIRSQILLAWQPLQGGLLYPVQQAHRLAVASGPAFAAVNASCRFSQIGASDSSVVPLWSSACAAATVAGSGSNGGLWYGGWNSSDFTLI